MLLVSKDRHVATSGGFHGNDQDQPRVQRVGCMLPLVQSESTETLLASEKRGLSLMALLHNMPPQPPPGVDAATSAILSDVKRPSPSDQRVGFSS